MNPKHFHTPISTRARCPVCQQPVYSKSGIHPQCAAKQAESPKPKPIEPEQQVKEQESPESVLVPLVSDTPNPKGKATAANR